MLAAHLLILPDEQNTRVRKHGPAGSLSERPKVMDAALFERDAHMRRAKHRGSLTKRAVRPIVRGKFRRHCNELAMTNNGIDSFGGSPHKFYPDG